MDITETYSYVLAKKKQDNEPFVLASFERNFTQISLWSWKMICGVVAKFISICFNDFFSWGYWPYVHSVMNACHCQWDRIADMWFVLEE